ncbi:MAG: IclR family transcriptional regulator [Fusobacteriaceae bacterium]|jgi:DNA-binding IclR family transcriptional regulator|nr:IclR family transcriptional regulator [Fusobacteriaceae bacterium]
MNDLVHVVDRIFAILEYLSQSSEAKGPTEIALATGLHKSTVYRLLSLMCQRGYIEKSESGGIYHIGVKLVEIASSHINNLELQTEARPFLQKLRDDLGLIVHLGILDRHDVVYVEKLDISKNIRLYAQIGLRVPAYCSSLGKCLLASLAGDDLEYLLEEKPLEQYTPNTITSIIELKKHLREVRSNGWAMDNEEYVIGNRCIGAPIYDYRGEVIAAVSASGPTLILTFDRIKAVAEHVKNTASKISRRLCYQDG